MEIKLASTTSSKSNQLQKINTVRWESRNTNSKSLVVVNITGNAFYILIQERRFFVQKDSLYSTEVLLDIYPQGSEFR